MSFRIKDTDVVQIVNSAAKVAGLETVVYTDYGQTVVNVMLRSNDAAIAATSSNYDALAESLRVYRIANGGTTVTYVYSMDVTLDAAQLDWCDVQNSFDRATRDLRTNPYPAAIRKTLKRFADNARCAIETELDALMFA